MDSALGTHTTSSATVVGLVDLADWRLGQGDAGSVASKDGRTVHRFNPVLEVAGVVFVDEDEHYSAAAGRSRNGTNYER
jgi:hypothetical protein